MRFSRDIRCLGVIALLACRTYGPGMQPTPDNFVASVAGSRWSLLELNGHTAAGGADGIRPILIFQASRGRAIGFGGCNQFQVTYRTQADTLLFDPPQYERGGCGAGMDLERAFFAALGATRRFTFDGGELVLLGRDGEYVAVFRRGAN